MRRRAARRLAVTVGCCLSLSPGVAAAARQEGAVDLSFQSRGTMVEANAPGELGWPGGLGYRTGSSVTGIGDVNGDGSADVAVGAPSAPAGGLSGAGVVHVVFGDPSRRNVDLANLDGHGFDIVGGTQDERLGTSLAPAGDVNADGRPDLIIGAQPLGRPGEVFVVFGRSSGSTVSASALGSAGFEIHASAGAATVNPFGSSVAGAGDLNGDHRADLIVGNPVRDPDPGRAVIVFGRASTSAVDVDAAGAGVAFLSAPVPDTFQPNVGTSVAGLGDVNGDRVPDVGVTGLGGMDRAAVAYGPFAPGDARDLGNLGGGGFTIVGQDPVTHATRNRFRQIDAVGDVDHDGRADVGVSNPGADIVRGAQRTGTVDIGAASLDGWASSLRVVRMAGLGDIDGDGIDDFAVAVDRGRGVGPEVVAEVVYGRPAAGGQRFGDYPPSGEFSAIAGVSSEGSVGAGGDLTGDGHPDVLVSSTGGSSIETSPLATVDVVAAVPPASTDRWQPPFTGSFDLPDPIHWNVHVVQAAYPQVLAGEDDNQHTYITSGSAARGAFSTAREISPLPLLTGGAFGGAPRVVVHDPTEHRARVLGPSGGGWRVAAQGPDGATPGTATLVRSPASVGIAIADQDNRTLTFVPDALHSWSSPQSFTVGPPTPLSRADVPLAAGDLNGDGHDDVVFAAQAGVGLLLAQADGRLAGPALLDPTPGARAVSIADADADGRPDVAIVSPGSSLDRPALLVHRNLGGGRFAAAAPRYLAEGPYIPPTDVDHDGRLDLVLSEQPRKSSYPALFHGLAGGGFDHRVDLLAAPARALPDHITFADVDGDHAPDLIGTGGQHGFVPYKAAVALNQTPGHAVPAPRQVDFGERAPGSRSSRSLAISSPWGSITPTLEGITGPGAAAFRVADTSCPQPGTHGTPTCSASLVFTPSRAGHFQATLWLRGSPGQALTEVPLSGDGPGRCRPPRVARRSYASARAALARAGCARVVATKLPGWTRRIIPRGWRATVRAQRPAAGTPLLSTATVRLTLRPPAVSPLRLRVLAPPHRRVRLRVLDRRRHRLADVRGHVASLYARAGRYRLAAAGRDLRCASTAFTARPPHRVRLTVRCRR